LPFFYLGNQGFTNFVHVQLAIATYYLRPHTAREANRNDLAQWGLESWNLVSYGVLHTTDAALADLADLYFHL